MAGLNDEEDGRPEPQPHVKPKIDEIEKLVMKNGRIDVLEEKMANARGDLGNIYQKIEKDLHGNRKAVKLIRTLLGGTEDAAFDFMRSFLHLADRFGLIPGEDLVDLAQNGKTAKHDPDDPGVSAVDKAPKGAKGAAKSSEPNAIDRAKAHLEGGSKPPAPKGPPGDLDLVDAGTAVAEDIKAGKVIPIGTKPAGQQALTH